MLLPAAGWLWSSSSCVDSCCSLPPLLPRPSTPPTSTPRYDCDGVYGERITGRLPQGGRGLLCRCSTVGANFSVAVTLNGFTYVRTYVCIHIAVSDPFTHSQCTKPQGGSASLCRQLVHTHTYIHTYMCNSTPVACG